MKTFYFEVTDTFGGEANFCWIRRLAIKANSLHGALIKLSKHEGLNFKKQYDTFYKAKNACICAFLVDYDVYNPEIYKTI